MALLQITDLNKIYHRRRPDEMTALADISLAIEPGEAVALTGPSGSGKTTLLSLLGCMARPTSGNIFLHERNIARLPERFLARLRRESFGFVFQHYQLLRDVSVLENVMLPLYPTERSFREMKAAAGAVLERFGMLSMAGKKVKQLSGGEQQRVAIARALIAQPEVIIADEPTAHLDGDLARELLRIFQDLHSEGTTLIMATHDPLLAQAAFVQHRIRLRFGRIEEDLLL